MNDTTNLDELIAAERAKAKARIAKLRAAAAAEQRKIDAKVIALLMEQEPDLYARLSGEARAALDAEKAERSRKAKATAAAPSVEPVPEAADTNEHSEEVRWNS